MTVATGDPDYGIKIHPDSAECDCDECSDMCSTPCWPLPHEAQALIDAGFGHKLEEQMYDLYYSEIRDYGTIAVLAPCVELISTRVSPDRCVFLLPDGWCALHSIKLKPYEGRVAHHSGSISVREDISRAWETKLGLRVAQAWRDDYGK